MILEPRKSPQEIDRRLSALHDPELAELLRAHAGDLASTAESYVSPSAPYWKKRIGYLTLAGLLAMSAGYASVYTSSHHGSRTKPHAIAITPPTHRHASRAVAHSRAAVHHAAPVAQHRAKIAPVHAVQAVGPSEAMIRQERAQLMHERAVAAAARADAARAQHLAQLALQAKAQAQARAQAQAQAEAIAQERAQEQAQAQAQAYAQARAQAQAQAQAEALARAQAQAIERAQQQALQNATDPNIKPGDGPPPDVGRISTTPSGSVPLPAPGPIDPNCTPHRGALFNSVLDHVRVGGTSVGSLLRIVHP